MDKDKIYSIDELKKKREEKNIGEKSVKGMNSIFGNLTDSEKEQLKSLMTSLGMNLDENMKKQVENIINAKNIDDLIENVSSDFFDPGMLGKISEEAKKANERYKVEYRYFRDFSQWQNIYKPYTLDKFLLIEQVKELADKLKIEYSNYDSKNDIIQKIKPKLIDYITALFDGFDTERINFVGNIIANTGYVPVTRRLTEKEEKQLDYFAKYGLIFRVNNSGEHALVIPNDILEAIYLIDFRKFLEKQKINDIICNSLCGIASLYGVIPYDKAKDIIQCYLDEHNIDNANLDKILKNTIEVTFSTSLVGKGYYTNAVVNNVFVYHPSVGFVEEFYKSQSGSQYEYKHFPYEYLIECGKEEYYPKSISMNTVWDILSSTGNEEEENTKNIIYTFSKMEFEPQIVIAILETMFEIPVGSKYELLIDSLKNISKQSEKWVLKGYRLGEETKNGEMTEKNEFDASKIINFDFTKK